MSDIWWWMGLVCFDQIVADQEWLHFPGMCILMEVWKSWSRLHPPLFKSMTPLISWGCWRDPDAPSAWSGIGHLKSCLRLYRPFIFIEIWRRTPPTCMTFLTTHFLLLGPVPIHPDRTIAWNHILCLTVRGRLWGIRWFTSVDNLLGLSLPWTILLMNSTMVRCVDNRLLFVFFKYQKLRVLDACGCWLTPFILQVFVRDFVPTALAFLMNGEPEIVKNFLLKTLRLQSWEKKVDQFKLGEGVMPASFKVFHDPVRKFETLIADFGESAIGRVAPVDSGFWWIILLRAYTKSTGDSSLADTPECQRGMRLILSLCLSEGFDTYPTLLCADGCCMIDRRMVSCFLLFPFVKWFQRFNSGPIFTNLCYHFQGVYGYPIEIQALFFMALRCALLLLKQDDKGKEFVERIAKRLHALSYHIQSYFWLDLKQLNDIYRYKTEEYSHTAVNKFNVMPDSLPDWVFDFMPSRGGYFIGNVSPARMDFRWFCLGNCVAILSSLATPEQSSAIMDLIESRWEELVGEIPLKICYPTLEGHDWRIVTGCDPKNTRWSYHNGGSWPGYKLSFFSSLCIEFS